MSIPSPIYLYRIIHIDNLPFIIRRNEITCPSHRRANPNYIGIGDDSLIAHRKTMPTLLKPGGTFNDYIAFYFGKRSPMLYNIKNGFQGVTRRSQNEIIYLVTSLDKVKEFRIPYVYFDGHGYHHLSQVFNTEEGFAYIDWKTVHASKWFDTEDDPDRKRRKQAEFLIYQSLPLQAIIAIATYSNRAKQNVERILGNVNKELNIVVKEEWYY
jgi:hypothetical protein